MHWLSQKLCRSFILWHWRAMENLRGNWLQVSNQSRKKSGNFILASQEVEISNFMGFFCLKWIFVQPKAVARVLSCGHRKFRGKLTPGFHFSRRKILQILLKHVRRVKFSDLKGFFWSDRYISSAKSCSKSFILWHWRTMESLGENWFLASNSV